MTNTSIPYYDHHSSKIYAQALQEKQASDLLPFLQKVEAGGRILDLGCGSGIDLAWICKAGYTGVGVEGSIALAEAARGLNPGIEILQQNFLFLTLKEKEWDGIWVNRAFNLLGPEAVQRMVAICFKGLKPAGVLGVVVEEGQGAFEDREHDLQGPSREIHLYSENQLCSMFEQTGFQITQVGRQVSTLGKKLMMVLAQRI